MRLIDADALLLRIDCHGTNKFGMLDEDIREYISKQPTITPESLRPQWIPVTERLPEKLVPVLIQHTYMEWAGISIGYITADDYWEWFGYFMGDDMLHHPPGDGLICPGSKYVTAWLPLPEPYKGEHDD